MNLGWESLNETPIVAFYVVMVHIMITNLMPIIYLKDACSANHKVIT